MEINLLCLEDVNIKIGSTHILRNIHFTLNKFQNTAIIGEAASGKSVLAQTIMGNHFFTGKKESPSLDELLYVGQQHLFTDYTNTRSNLYYQQRFQSFDESTTSTVADYLSIGELASPTSFLKTWMDILNIQPLLHKNLIHLSNGENKRVQLFKSIRNKPALIIFDQPFIGLDTSTRQSISQAFSLLNQYGITYLLLTSHIDLPSSVEQVFVLKNQTLSEPISLSEFLNNASKYYQPLQKTWNTSLLSFEKEHPPYQEYVKMINTSVKYGNKYSLKDINWKVSPHSAWCVYGPNGAGKSTLLSLINADHPQVYSNEVYLFDRKRGTGESIWDVKKNIGFLSPELHMYFDVSATCFETIASGLFDTIGLFRKISHEQTALVKRWLEILDLQHLSDKRLHSCSTGEQIQILLARACIKQPALLVLDEPCQGLDEYQTQSINQLIDAIFENSNMSLIYVTHYHHQLPKCIQQYLKLDQGNATIHS